MATVSLTINGRAYDVACEDGQEDHLRALGQMVDERLKNLVSSVGQVGESRLLIMVSLILADELNEAKSAGAGSGASGGQADSAAAAVEQLAEKVERIAARLEDA